MDTWVCKSPVFVSSYLSHLQCFPLCGIIESQTGFVIWIWKLSNSPFYNGENWGTQRPSDVPKVRGYIRALQRSKPTGYKRRFMKRKLSPSKRPWKLAVWFSLESEGLKTAEAKIRSHPQLSQGKGVNSSLGGQTWLLGGRSNCWVHQLKC